MKRILLFALLAAIASTAQGQSQTATSDTDTAVRIPAPRGNAFQGEPVFSSNSDEPSPFSLISRMPGWRAR